MRKFLIILGLILLNSCMPLANFETYDIYSNYEFVYDENVMIKDEWPPEILEKGEGFIMYRGKSEKTIYRKHITTIFVGEYIFPISCKVKVPNGSKIYEEIINKGEPLYRRYIIVNSKKYMMYSEISKE